MREKEGEGGIERVCKGSDRDEKRQREVNFPKGQNTKKHCSVQTEKEICSKNEIGAV